MKKIFIGVMAGILVLTLAGGSSFAAMQIRKRTAEPKAEEAGGAAGEAKPATEDAPAPRAAAPAEAEPEKEEAKAAAPQEKAAADSPKSEAAPEPKKPAVAKKPAGKTEITNENAFSGVVELSKGPKVLVKINKPVVVGSRAFAFDQRLRKRGILKIVKPIGDGVHLCKLLKGDADSGYWIALETENEAYARVKRSSSLKSLKEFLEVFPESKHTAEVSALIFKLLLRTTYPVASGSVIKGKVDLTEKVGQEMPLGRIKLKLDMYVVGMTDDSGQFRIDGLPLMATPVKINLAVHDERYSMAEGVSVDIPVGPAGEVEKTVPIKIAPTYITGLVVDENGAPVRGAQVWTSPYTTEKLTDEKGEYKISRKKKIDASGTPQEGDEPMFGKDYEVFAYKQGFGAEKAAISAKSYQDNQVEKIVLSRQELAQDGLPALDVSLRDNLDLMQFVISAGSGPKINR